MYPVPAARCSGGPWHQEDHSQGRLRCPEGVVVPVCPGICGVASINEKNGKPLMHRFMPISLLDPN